MSDETLTDRLAIRDVVESWVIARDCADWERFRAQWHDDGYMMATWFQGPKDDFIRVSQEGFARGVNILHYTGASQSTVNGPEILGTYPEGYRHLAYLQVQAGYPVKADMPGAARPGG